MANINRRAAIATAVASGVTVATLSGTAEAQEPELTQDQEYVMAAGLDKDEAIAWKKAAEAAAAFFKLPELHPNDRREVATAIHVLQNKLLARPTYRKYLESAKAGFEKRKQDGKK